MFENDCFVLTTFLHRSIERVGKWMFSGVQKQLSSPGLMMGIELAKLWDVAVIVAGLLAGVKDLFYIGKGEIRGRKLYETDL